MSATGLLNATATIERATPSTGATGEVTLGWSTVASNVRCALQVKRGVNLQREAGAVSEIEAVLYLPPATDVRPSTGGGPGDRVVIAGAAWRVQHVHVVGDPAKLVRAEVRREA